MSSIYKADSVKEIQLTCGGIALVDAEDYDLLTKNVWWSFAVDRVTYAVRSHVIADGEIIQRFMHRVILNNPPYLIDHIDRNGLNNVKSNLRKSNCSLNMANSAKHRHHRGKPCTSKYKGVQWHKINSAWLAIIMVNGRTIFLGLYDEEKDAALAYDIAAFTFFGEFARTNFPIEYIINQNPRSRKARAGGRLIRDVISSIVI